MQSHRCTSDVQFYVSNLVRFYPIAQLNYFIQTPKNYHRALIWTAVMTFFSHVDPSFGSVFAIEAANEVLTDPSLTPGYGQCRFTVS